MTALENILSHEIVQKLGWTLVHFIWQAAAVALLLAVLLAILRRASANLRYTVACLALGLIVLLPVVTIQLVPVSTPEPSVMPPPAPAPVVLPAEQVSELPVVEVPIVEPPVPVETAVSVPAVPWRQRISEKLEPALPYVVAAWLLGVFALSIWHLGGWTQLQRLRRKMVKPVDASLRTKLDELAEKLAVKRAVQLTESALVQIPTVVGWLRPVILLPASALTGLTSEQLDAILAHELAHIRRHDYLVNILQTIVETLGFYHPAVWWVSHKIRTERENCCDDLAVAVSGDRLGYARALTSMEEIRAARSELAVAASGGDLLERVCRLLGKDSVGGSQAGWMPSVITALLITTIAIPTTVVLNADSQPQQSELEINVRVEDEESGSVETAGTKEPTAENIRTVHFPEDRAVGTLKVRMARRDEESDRGLLSLPGWILLDREAQGDVNLHAGVELRLEVSRDVTDLSFLSDLEPNDLQVLMLSNMNISDEELVHLKGLTGLLGLDLGSTTIEGDGLVHLAPLESLRRLSLFNTQVSDAGLAHLSALRSLKYLTLCMTQVRGPGLKHLKSLTSLVSLDLAATPITDESLVHLAELPWLRELPIYDTDITDKGLAHLKPLRSLESLILGKSRLRHDYSPITDEGLVHLKELHSLRDLHLLRTRVTDAGLAHLSTLTKLEALDLKETQITGEGLAFLKDLPALTYLDLKQTGVGRAGLAHLKEMTKLRRLDLGEVSMGQADLKELEDALPNCRVNAKSVSSSAGTVSITRATAENPASAGEHETLVRVDCRVLEVYTSMRLDRETTIAAENLLAETIVRPVNGEKGVPQRIWPSGRDVSRSRKPTVEEFIREVVGTTVLAEEPSSVTGDAQTMQKIIDLLASRGAMKILMDPTLEVMDGAKGRVESKQKVPMGKAASPSSQPDQYTDLIDYLEITAHIVDGDKIKLLAEGTINRVLPPQGKEQQPTIKSSTFSTEVTLKPGWSLIMGGASKSGQASEDGSDADRSMAEFLVIISPTIVDSATGLESSEDVPVEDSESSSDRSEDSAVSESTRGAARVSKGTAPSDRLARPVRIDCVALEIYPHAPMDREAIIAAENLLGKKTSDIASGKSEPTVEELIRAAAGTHVWDGVRLEEASIVENSHAKPEQLTAMVDLLASGGFVKILMNPTLEVVEGQTGRISSGQSYVQVTPEILDGSKIKLLAEAAIAREFPRQDEGQLPMVSQTSVSTQVVVKSGMSLIVGGTKTTSTAAEAESKVEDPEKSDTDVLFILTATIVNEQNTAESPVGKAAPELKELGIELKPNDLDGNKILVCFWDMEQRPSRNLVSELARQKRELEQKHIIVALAHSSDVETDKLRQWLDDRKIPFACGSIEENAERVLYNWGVQAQPWLVLIDERGVVTAGGFGLESLTPEGLDELVARKEAATRAGNGPARQEQDAPEAATDAQRSFIEKIEADRQNRIAGLDEELAAIATTKALPQNMVTRVYDVTDLVGEPADHGGMSRLMQAQDLVRLIQKRVEPESWYDLNAAGEGTITPYPIQEPKKLAVYNTHKTHLAIERLLEDMRSSGAEKEDPKYQILIETRILTATDDFLESVELDANSVHTSEVWSEHLVADSAAEPNSQQYSLILDDLNVNLLLKATRTPEGKGIKSLAAPAITAQAGQPTQTRMVSLAQLQMVPDEYRFRSPRDSYERSSEAKSNPERIEVGTFIRVLPYLTADKKNVRLDFEWELREVRGFEERVGPDKKKHKFPLLTVNTVKTAAVVPDGKTLLIGGKKISRRTSRTWRKPLLGDLPLVGGLFRMDRKTEDTENILILVKPTINPQKKAPPTVPSLGPDEPLVEKLREKLDSPTSPKQPPTFL